jgi:hypothetical protein
VGYWELKKNMFSVERLGFCLTGERTSYQKVRCQFMQRHKSAMPNSFLVHLFF